MKEPIGNVCPGHRDYDPDPMMPFGPHEPADWIRPVVSPFAWPIRQHACKHCGALYVEVGPVGGVEESRR